MRKLLLIVLLILAGCVNIQQFQERIDCSESYKPELSLEIVREYAPLEVRDFLEATEGVPCIDRVVQRAKLSECIGTGWDCARLSPFFWGFIGEEQTVEVFIWDVPGKGQGLYYKIPGQEGKRLIVCEYMAPPKKGLEQAQGMLKDWCYTDGAETIQSNSLCMRITSDDIRKECEARYVADANVCKGITAQGIKQKCYAEVARIRADVRICELLADSFDQNACKAMFKGFGPIGPTVSSD